jgi:hypothetical protein
VYPDCHDSLLYHGRLIVLRHTGRAAAEVGWHLHRLGHVLLTIAVLLSVAVLGCAWRLSRGPVDLGFLRHRVEKAINSGTGPVRVTFGDVSIAWGGFSHGLDQPLILRLTNLTVTTTAGSDRVQIPLAEAALSARWLLLGRVVPRRITLDGARLLLARKADGSLSFDIGGSSEGEGTSPLISLLAVLGAPAETDRQAGNHQLSQLSAVSIHDATLRLDDRLLGMTWSADRADIDLTRHRGGGMDGQASLALVLGGQHAVLDGTFNLAPEATSVHVAARLSQVTPKALAASAPNLAPLAALDVPLNLTGEADFASDLTPSHFRLTARAGAGTVSAGSGAIPIRRADLTVAGTPAEATIENAIIELQPIQNSNISTVNLGGKLTHQAGQLTATLHLALDHVDFADLPALWPTGISPPTRAWITANITSGTAHDGKADVVLVSADTDPEPGLINATATLEGDNIAVTWLPSVPPVEQAKAHLVLTDLDKLEIDVRSARQKVNGADPIAVQNGHVTITGLAGKDQLATVRLAANGSIPSALALLKEPRLHLFERHPMDLRAPSGDVAASLQTVVPLRLNVKGDDVAIHGMGALSRAHLTGVVAGRDLDDGAFAFDVDNNHLSLKGTGRLAGVQANIDGTMDFRAGPPSQVTLRLVANGPVTERELSAAGLDTAGALTGEAALNVVLNEYRNGGGEVTADADLAQAELYVSPLGWRKPAGAAARASAHLTLMNDKLTGIDQVAIDAPGAQARGVVTVLGGKPDTVRLDRLVLGRTDVRGAIQLPRQGPISIDLVGPALDVSAKLLEKSAKRDPAAPETAGPAWSMRGRFDRVYLAHNQVASQLAVSADNDGLVFRGLSLTARTGSGKPIKAQIGQQPGQPGQGHAGRRLVLNTEDAGSVLDGLDITNSILDGVLTVDGEFNDATQQHMLSGTLTLTDFRVSHAPGLGKLLQAVTLYGLVDALSGPGLAFATLTAPFQYYDDTLVLSDARAFSSSLGLTAKGKIDWGAGQVDVEGTLVPEYVFNSLLGRIPLVGGLFSAEKGGGLFAVSYSLRGPIDNPAVVANPLTALTPGILRGMFGLFDQAPAQSPALDQTAPRGNVEPQ